MLQRWPNRLTGMVIASFGAGLLAAGLLHLPQHSQASVAAPAHVDPTTGSGELISISDAFANVAERVKPSVVYIESSRQHKPDDGELTIPREFAPFFQGIPRGSGQPQVERGSGSGFIVSADGDILTNAHVVDGADRVMVRLLDRREYPAKVLGTDPTTDIALLHVNATGLTPATIGNSDDAKVGEWVLAVGNPIGENLSFTVTSGIISAKGRTLQLPNQNERSIQDFIQTDAAINPGNSGGPLVNVRGEVIGVNAAIASETGYYTGYGFAVPVNIARQVMAQLAHGGHVRRSMLGVKVKDATETDAEYVGLPRIRGVVVEDLGAAGSPARRAGMEEGDVIIAVDGKPVDYVGQVQQDIAFHAPGDQVAVEVARKGGARKTLHVTVQEAPPVAEAMSAHRPSTTGDEKASVSLGPLGLTVTPGEAGGVKGLVVTAVAADGPCAEQVATPEEGGPDVIVSIEGRTVASVADAESALRGRERGAIVELVLYNTQARSRRIERIRLGG
jgi:serine protease Do